MNGDRWRMVKGLFRRALDLPRDAWPEYLDRVSAGDASLREEVASLLAEHSPGSSTSEASDDAEEPGDAR